VILPLLLALWLPPKIQECREKPSVKECQACCVERAPKQLPEKTRQKMCEKVCREGKEVSPSGTERP
jgi:hypothetical protein